MTLAQLDAPTPHGYVPLGTYFLARGMAMQWALFKYVDRPDWDMPIIGWSGEIYDDLDAQDGNWVSHQFWIVPPELVEACVMAARHTDEAGWTRFCLRMTGADPDTC